MELGGIPLVTVLSQVTGLPCRFVRKEPKTYGTRRLGLELRSLFKMAELTAAAEG